MERVEITTSLTQADWEAYQAHWSERNLGGQRIQVVGALLGAAVIFVALVLSNYLGAPLSPLSLIAGILLGTAASTYTALRARRVSRPDPDGFVLGPSTIVIADAGIDILKSGSWSRHAWSIVQDLAWTDQHLFVWVDRVAAFIVPLRDLPAGVDRTRLAAELQAMRTAPAQNAAEPDLPVLEQLPLARQEEPAAVSSPLRRFLRAYSALLLFRVPAADDLRVPSRLVLLFPVIGILLWLIVNRWSAGADATFYPYGVLVWSWYAVIVLASLWAASKLAQPRVPYERLLVLIAAFLPVALALGIAQDQWVRPDWIVVTSIAIAIYSAHYLSRTLRSLTGHRQSRAASTYAMILCVAVWATHAMYFSGDIWYSNDESEEEGSDYWTDMARSESLMYEQPRRIDAAVRALQRPAELPAAAFFVGFAGQGEQSVFAGEIALARKVIAAKFGSAQRSVLLVNDRRDLDTLPFASPTALRYALKGIAERMRLESDVLFLSLSSHGSKDGEISVSNGMLSLNDLSTDELATALRESGIKWRVIIVSACYAGKFIDPLRDENTIIVTAAAADRTSFGCSDDRDLTYFGEAFYRDALPAALDLKTAFEKASEKIAAREEEEGKTASNPQAYFGRALAEHLKNVH